MKKPIKNEKEEREFLPIKSSELKVLLKKIMEEDAELLRRLAD